MMRQWLGQRRIQVAMIIVALLALNLWRWWPDSTPSRNHRVDRQPVSGFQPGDFEIRAIPDSIPGQMHRDLFQNRQAIQNNASTRKIAIKPPAKTPEELAREAAQAELAGYRCAGVSVRGGRYQAFITRGGQNYLVSQGDKVGNRFIVDKITAEAVVLTDPETGVGGQIAVSGR